MLGNDLPQPSISADPTSGALPLSVNFDAAASTDSDGSIVSYGWDFGDGSNASGVTASHTFTSVGTFTVSLTVADNSGDSATTTVAVEVLPAEQNNLFTVDVVSGDAPLAVTFTGTAIDAGGTIPDHAWDFGDGSSSSESTVTHTYADPGTYTATLVVTYSDSSTETASAVIAVSAANQAPQASFSASPTTGPYPLEVQFDATGSSDSDGSIAGYAWNFGDGATGTGATTSRTDTSAATFNAVLTVTDDGGSTSSAAQAIDVAVGNLPPAASFSHSDVPLGSEAPISVSFDASSSSDDGSIASYAWSFGDGATASGVTANHTYVIAGTFTVTLTLTDDTGLTGTQSETIQIDSHLFSTNKNRGHAPLEVIFQGTPGGIASSQSWDFGDGSGSTLMGTSHTYASQGTYVATFSITYQDSSTDSDSVMIIVDPPNQAPSAELSANPVSGDAPLAVSFDGSTSTDADGTVQSYQWDFGDGSSSSGVTSSHTYTTEGAYSAVLTVIDDDGASDAASVTISVSQEPSGNQLPVASFTVDATLNDYIQHSMDASASFDSDGSIVSYDWDFGDGSSGSGATVDHVYFGAGPYTITLTVTDNEGATASTQKSSETNLSVGTGSALGTLREEPDDYVSDSQFISPADPLAANPDPGAQTCQTFTNQAAICESYTREYRRPEDYASADLAQFVQPGLDLSGANVLVGTMPGQLDVDSAGAATMSVPLTLPPGTRGVLPSLSLEYSSQAHNGLLGMGWRLAGLSSISRCGTTAGRDGFIDPVDFDDNDRLCLNGQALIPAGDGSYRTEIDSFTKVVPAESNGVVSFSAFTKEGWILTFGGTPESQLRLRNEFGQVADQTIAWALTRAE